MIKGARKLVDKGIIDFDKSLPQKDIIKARHGVAAVASLLGAVVSSNIITPIVRNNYASYMQKRYLKAVAENKTVGYTLPMFKDSYKNPITMNSFLAFTNRGNLKI